MASNTATYSFLLPTVGGDSNLWGGYLNSNFEDLEDLLDGTSQITDLDIAKASVNGTGYFKLPEGTTAQRPGSPTNGMVRLNSTIGQFEGYNGAWGALGGAGLFRGENGETGDKANGAGDIFRGHEQTLNTDTTLTSGKNWHATGTLTVASGVTLTVESGAKLTVI